MPAHEDTLAAIDAAIGDEAPAPDAAPCAQCGAGLTVDAPSGDFCSEDCHRVWHVAHGGPVPMDGGNAPDEATPEAAPVASLAWLGPPPPGAVARPGHEILDEVAAFVGRFNAFPSEHCAPMLALWYAHTHAAEHFYVTPRLILDSAEPGSGKTRVLEVAQFLVKAPEMTISATTAALFRMMSDGPITVLFDEVDTIFNPRSSGNHEDLRAMLNAGYKRTATVARCVGDARNMKVDRFRVYAPAALAGIAGNMPDTITTRAVTVHMRRRAPDEHVEPFRERTVEREAHPLREELAAWIDSITEQLADAMPAMPKAVQDRAAEIWEPLLAVADQAGDHWPDTARAACLHFVTEATKNGKGSLGVRLLGDVRALFEREGTDRMSSAEILAGLYAIEDAPWGDLSGSPLNARGLAKFLGRYGVESKNVKQRDGSVPKGYRLDAGLADAFRRYLPSAATSATSATSQVIATNASATPPLPPLPDQAEPP